MKKKTIIVVVILVILGLAVAAGLLFNKSKESGNGNDADREKVVTADIPQMNAYYKNERIGKIIGYTMKMDDTKLRDVIIPVSSDRQAPISISTKGNKIQKISHEVKEAEGNKLIDSGEITEWKENKGVIQIHYQASAIMKAGKEYLLCITLQTEQHDNIYYYARIMVMEEDFIAKQIAFAKDFSDKTFVEAKSKDLAAYLEPNSKYASDSLGQTTIRSSYGMLIWKTFHPEKIADTEVTTKDFCIKNTGQAGTYTMTYQIKATNAQKMEERYNVSETITVWSYAGKLYVLAYDREVHQIWEANKNNVGSSFIDLGIQKETEIAHEESENQQFIAYAINGDVYAMDLKNKKIVPIYKAKQADSEELYRTKSRVLKADDKGNVDYMVYGYSKSDKHVGKNGISIMRYESEKNQSTERAFIPCDVPASILQQRMSELCYVGDGTVYMMLDDNIYYVNLKTKEWGNLAGTMEAGSCVVNESGTKIAYNTNGKKQNSDSITIVDLSNGNKNIIEAGAGKKIAVCGYTGSNLVYGLAEAQSNQNYPFFPIKELKIIDADLKEIKSYSKQNLVLSNVQITDTIISFKRWKKGKQVADDQLLDNTENQLVAAKSSYYMDDTKLKELALAFTNNLDSKVELQVGKLGEVRFDGRLEVKPKFERPLGERFYAYGYGKLQGIYSNKDEAIRQAKEHYGLVTDERGAKIWVFEENYE